MGARNRMRGGPVSRAVIDHFNKNLGVVTRTQEGRLGESIITGFVGCYTYPDWYQRSGAADERARQELRDAQFEMRREGGMREREELREAA